MQTSGVAPSLLPEVKGMGLVAGARQHLAYGLRHRCAPELQPLYSTLLSVLLRSENMQVSC